MNGNTEIILARMLGEVIAPKELRRRIDRVDRLSSRVDGGQLLSRQVIAIIVEEYERLNPLSDPPAFIQAIVEPPKHLRVRKERSDKGAKRTRLGKRTKQTKRGKK